LKVTVVMMSRMSAGSSFQASGAAILSLIRHANCHRSLYGIINVFTWWTLARQ